MGEGEVGGGFCKAKHFKEMCEALLNFQRGGRVLEKIPSLVEVWIFSRTLFSRWVFRDIMSLHPHVTLVYTKWFSATCTFAALHKYLTNKYNFRLFWSDNINMLFYDRHVDVVCSEDPESTILRGLYLLIVLPWYFYSLSLSNRPQVAMVYWLINHVAHKHLRLVISEFFSCSSIIPSGLSAFRP